MRKDSFEEHLKCILTEQELKKAGEIMAQAHLDLVSEEDGLKSVSAQFKARIAQHEATIGISANKIQSGCEYRPVPCHEEENGKNIVVVREDTGEIVKSRPMTKEEQQQKIDFGDQN